MGSLTGVDLSKKGAGGTHPPPPKMKPSSYLLLKSSICLQHYSVIPFLSGVPVLRKILDPPMIINIFKALKKLDSSLPLGQVALKFSFPGQVIVFFL